jgi:indole-3-glycerol phosphate synthase
MVEQAHQRVERARRERPLTRPVTHPDEEQPAVVVGESGPARPPAGRLVAAIVAGSGGEGSRAGSAPGSGAGNAPGSGAGSAPGGRSEGETALIAEVKRASPSKGAIAPGLDAVAQARAYAAAGADAVSVLTEPRRFGGSLGDLEAVVAAVPLPVLRKDFVVDPYQVWEAAAAGAAAVLLITAALDDRHLALLLGECRLCGLDALVEVHDEAELGRAADAGAALIGINNRDLRSLTVDLRVTERLAALAPRDLLLVGESGIVTGADARRAARAGTRALLVGEVLVRAPHERLAALIAELKGRPAVADGSLPKGRSGTASGSRPKGSTGTASGSRP